eukprot:11844420-Ditylum_brightwellii.AAC.1
MGALRCPTWCLHTILHLRSQDVDWGSLNVGVLHEQSGKASLSKEFNRCQAMSLVGEVIMQISSIIKCERLGTNLNLVRPVNHSMNKHCSVPKGNGLDSAFSSTILVVCPNATEGEALRLQLTISLISIWLENTIVCMIVFDADIKLGGKAFKSLLCVKGIIGIKGNLVLMVQ